jgi:glycogen operon protein
MGVLLDGRAQETGIRRIGTDSTLLLVLNAHHDVVNFRLPEAVGGHRWVRLVDTNRTTPTRWRTSPSGRVRGDGPLPDPPHPGAHPHRRRATDAERSFQHVVQAFEEAADTPVAFGTAGRGG